MHAMPRPGPTLALLLSAASVTLAQAPPVGQPHRDQSAIDRRGLPTVHQPGRLQGGQHGRGGLPTHPGEPGQVAGLHRLGEPDHVKDPETAVAPAARTVHRGLGAVLVSGGDPGQGQAERNRSRVDHLNGLGPELGPWNGDALRCGTP
jgi:hypothetical protein